MKLDTAIRETVLREAKVVAGEENLDRDIAWVHMVDHPDIAQWVKSGELLLTTGYNWPTDANASRHLVCELAKAGLAGVVLAIPKFRDHFPPEAVEEAQRVGLPMFELPWAVPFSQVTHEILAKIINFQVCEQPIRHCSYADHSARQASHVHRHFWSGSRKFDASS
jgi:purine catabolism regulator